MSLIGKTFEEIDGETFMAVEPTKLESYFSEKFYGQAPKIIYHYCNTDTFVKTINNSTIRLHNVTKSNDSKEVVYIKPLLVETLDRIRKYYNSQVTNEESKIEYPIITHLVDNYFEQSSRIYFAMCFSCNPDKLSQWERYADRGRGVAIGFDSKCLSKLQATNSGYIFSRVVYGLNELANELNKRTDDLLSNGKFLNIEDFNNYVRTMLHCLSYYAPLYKNAYFKDEEEWRLVFLPTKHFHYLDDLNLQEWLKDVNQKEYRRESCGFVRQPIGYAADKNSIRAHIDIDFSELKTDLIKEVRIGPASDLNNDDEDLKWMLLQNGYFPSIKGGARRVKIAKVYESYRGK